MGTFDINIHPRVEGIDFIWIKSPPIACGMVPGNTLIAWYYLIIIRKGYIITGHLNVRIKSYYLKA